MFLQRATGYFCHEGKVTGMMANCALRECKTWPSRTRQHQCRLPNLLLADAHVIGRQAEKNKNMALAHSASHFSVYAQLCHHHSVHRFVGGYLSTKMYPEWKTQHSRKFSGCPTENSSISEVAIHSPGSGNVTFIRESWAGAWIIRCCLFL